MYEHVGITKASPASRAQRITSALIASGIAAAFVLSRLYLLQDYPPITLHYVI